MDNFRQERVAADNLKQDIAGLERAVTATRGGDFDTEVFWSVGALQNPNTAPELRAALTELQNQEASLRTARVTYTDNHDIVKEKLRSIHQLRNETIPRQAATLLMRWKQREQDVEVRIARAERDLRQIPARSIEEQRLRRNVEVRQNLYRTLKNRFEEARLAEVSTVPDVSVLDRAVAPATPNSSSAPKLMLMALIGCIGVGCALAILLDRFDRKLNYPDQITRDLQLGIVGAVPRASKKSNTKSVEEAASFVEAFRTLLVNLQYALPRGGPIRLAVSSPGQGDGKSFVSSNLALSFAEAGYRTLLLDGDTRRGELHNTFGADRLPGLVDYLAGTATIDEVLRPTSQERLTLIPCGKRVKRSPELLASQRLVELLAELHTRYDVIIVDTPPLGAGVDAFVMSIATQHLVLVMRSGQTDRKLAEAKLELLDRLPVTVLGAVLNDVPTEGQFKYYSYLPGYEAEEESESALLRG
jgi:tyrosine-protein kinase Etk/Wzc